MFSNYHLTLSQIDGGWQFSWTFELDGKPQLLHQDNTVHTCMNCCYGAGMMWINACGPKDIREYIKEGLHREKLVRYTLDS